MNFGERVFENTPSFLRQLAREITSRGITPEIECFDIGQIGNAVRLQQEGLLPGPGGKWWFQFCLGVRGGAPADAQTLLTMCSLVPVGAEWSVLAIGRGQLAMNMLAIIEGGHVRTGIEDNIYFRRGQLVDGNGQFVERLVRMAQDLGRPVATPDQAREIIGCRTPAAEAGSTKGK
jgi:3-keto-5-aminohexanoate cleavage enzyme